MTSMSTAFLPGGISGFPTLESAAALQMQVVQYFGGEPGIRDHDELDTVLTSVRDQPYEGPVQAAATLMRALALNSCFIDANKRMALGLAVKMLNANGYDLEVSNADAIAFIAREIQGKGVPLHQVIEWLNERLSERV